MCACPISESKLKSGIGPLLIYMDFIGLVTWPGGNRATKEKSIRLKECLRVSWSKNLEHIVYKSFIPAFGLGPSSLS